MYIDTQNAADVGENIKQMKAASRVGLELTPQIRSYWWIIKYIGKCENRWEKDRNEEILLPGKFGGFGEAK